MKSFPWPKPKANKYGAIRCEWNGIKFASKLEMNYYKQLQMLNQQGIVKFFLFQVPFHLIGGVKYIVDFVVFHTDGTVEFIDTKGRDTPISKLKRKQVEAMYPVEIKIVTKV